MSCSRWGHWDFFFSVLWIWPFVSFALLQFAVFPLYNILVKLVFGKNSRSLSDLVSNVFLYVSPIWLAIIISVMHPNHMPSSRHSWIFNGAIAFCDQKIPPKSSIVIQKRTFVNFPNLNRD